VTLRGRLRAVPLLAPPSSIIFRSSPSNIKTPIAINLTICAHLPSQTPPTPSTSFLEYISLPLLHRKEKRAGAACPSFHHL